MLKRNLILALVPLFASAGVVDAAHLDPARSWIGELAEKVSMRRGGKDGRFDTFQVAFLNVREWAARKGATEDLYQGSYVHRGKKLIFQFAPESRQVLAERLADWIAAAAAGRGVDLGEFRVDISQLTMVAREKKSGRQAYKISARFDAVSSRFGSSRGRYRARGEARRSDLGLPGVPDPDPDPDPGEDPAILLSLTSVDFSAAEGGPNPAPRTVAVTRGGTGTLTGLSARVIHENQPAGWLSAVLDRTSAPATLTLRPTTGSLRAGTYRARVEVASARASNSPQTVSVSFSVQGPQTGSVRVIASTSGSGIDPTGYVVSMSRGRFEEISNIGVSGFVVFRDLSPGPHTVTLSDIAPTCAVVGDNPRTVNVVAGSTVETTFHIRCQQSAPSRQVTITNNMPGSLNLHDVVRVKVSRSNSFGRGDLLTNDPARCLDLPGESIRPGASRTFEITAGDDYFVFIGIGIWDMDNFGCTLYRNWFKRCFFTDFQFQTWYVWTVVRVNGHGSGNWNWVIRGSYLNGTLTVTPAGQAAIPFQVTANDPIR